MNIRSYRHTKRRVSQITVYLSVWLAGISPSLMAQSLTFQTGPAAPDLQCPDSKPTSRPPSNPKPLEEIYEIPNDGLLAELMKSLPAQSESVTSSLNLFSNLPKSRPLNIGLWGDSHAAANFFTEELIRAINLPKEKVLPLFIPPTLARGGVRLPLRKQCQGQGWKYELAYTGGQDRLKFSRGMARLITTTNNSYQWIDFRIQGQQPNLLGLDILYAASPIPTTLGISIDELPEQFVELEVNERGAIKIQSEGGLISTLKLRLIKGSVGIEGFVPTYAEPALLYFDTLAIPGATMRSWRLVDPEYFTALGNQAAYDVVLLQYGTNEGNQTPFNLARYESDLTASLENFRRIYPDAVCVLLGPTDRGALIARSGKAKPSTDAEFDATQGASSAAIINQLLAYSRIHQQISRSQRSIGQQYGCGFWDWQRAMGGPGGSYAWLKKNPSLMARDLIHLTVTGYQTSARLFNQEMHLHQAFK